MIESRFFLSLFEFLPNFSSGEIRENSLIYLNEETDVTTRNECIMRMKFLLLKLKQMQFQSSLKILSEMKNHLLLLHETLYDVLKRLASNQNELRVQEKTWRKTCDALII